MDLTNADIDIQNSEAAIYIWSVVYNFVPPKLILTLAEMPSRTPYSTLVFETI